MKEKILILLAISSSTNPSASECINKLPILRDSEMHTTHISSKGDERGLRDLGINVTTDAEFSHKIYVGD